DESTDITFKKCLAFMIRYFSQSKSKIETTFYQMLEIQDGTAITMCNAVKYATKKDKLPLHNLIGIGVDGTNSMVGSHNSVSKHLKDSVPHLVVVKCICHSLHLAASKGNRCSALPSRVCGTWFTTGLHTAQSGYWNIQPSTLQ
ncbi:UNVERIFIED_CONTAM: hypothetical protein FKN15_027233, partial [Acipenser sinensis]